MLHHSNHFFSTRGISVFEDGPLHTAAQREIALGTTLATKRKVAFHALPSGVSSHWFVLGIVLLMGVSRAEDEEKVIHFAGHCSRH